MRGGLRNPPGGRPKSDDPKIYSCLLKTPDGTFSRKLTASEAEKVKAYIEDLRKT
jgi:hypothetical protein